MAQITQELSPKAPQSTVCCWPVQQNIILVYFLLFGREKGVKSDLKWLLWLAFWPLNGLKLAPNCPKMTPKHAQQYSIVVVSTTVHYLGALRWFWGDEKGKTSPKLLILIPEIAWFLTLNSYNLAKFCPISPSSTSFENYKAWQTFLDHFWRSKLQNKTENSTRKGATLCCHNCILTEFTKSVPDNVRGLFWPFHLYRTSKYFNMKGRGVFTKRNFNIMQFSGT